MMDRKVVVNLGDRSYDIVIGGALLSRLHQFVPFSLKGRAVFVLTDKNVVEPHGAALFRILQDEGARSVEMLALPPGEQTKSFSRLEQVLSWMLDHKADRKAVLFTLGGGVIGDLGGLSAAMLMRGIPFVQIPTSLLAQVDSSVGGKTGINTGHGKNLVGAFYQPVSVLCDRDILQTLPKREILAGYAEIAKYGLLGNKDFFEWLEDNGSKVCALDPESLTYAVEVSCRMKADIVAADEREHDSRALLNLGHTFGHALEASANYDGRLLHGEAVAIGIILAFRLSVLMDICPADAAARIEAHFKAIGLPTEVRDISPMLGTSAEAIVAHMDHDKKAENGRAVFILARDIGQAFISREVDMRDVLKIVRDSL